MGEYSLTGQIPWYRNIIRNVAFNISSFIDSFSKEVTMELIVPTNIVKRSQLICSYISEEAGIEFGIYDLIMYLYKDFIRNATKKYDPVKILRDLSRTYSYDETITISYGGNNTYEFNKMECSRKKVEITMTKENASQGQLLLDEINDLYGHSSSLDRMVYRVWINFIEDYKRGEENKVVKQLIKIIKSLN